MALSLFGERSVSAGSHRTFGRTLFAWVARARTARANRKALRELMDIDPARLRDLGIEFSDIGEALSARQGRTPGMILGAARARNARS